ncbi:LLM class F420-dependent oxidoreductase [Dactylosporangium sp. CA-092794]|uniref:LLM class F420-dependent oxidoreductase n=1 Tax=Dactylosporangium sp. CA-092794 TaxID=3239929 RepID=UPI003D8E4534
MKIGVLFYVTRHTIDAMTIARAVEDAGFDSFWVPEHAIKPTKPKTPYRMTGGEVPQVYGEMADPFITLSYIAAATSTLRIGTGVCIVTEHHPLRLAKAVGTLDSFSNGRLLFGIGTGWMPEEVELFGTQFRTRWRYTRESVEAMKALWVDGTASYEGELVKFPSLKCDPIPAQRPHPPIILGGQPVDRLPARIAAWADGWMASGVSPGRIAEVRKRTVEECERLGRDPSTIEFSAIVRGASAEIQEAYAEAGVQRLIVALYNHDGVPVYPDGTEEGEQRYLAAAARCHAAPPPSPAETLRAVEMVRTSAGLG